MSVSSSRVRRRAIRGIPRQGAFEPIAAGDAHEVCLQTGFAQRGNGDVQTVFGGLSEGFFSRPARSNQLVHPDGLARRVQSLRDQCAEQPLQRKSVSEIHSLAANLLKPAAIGRHDRVQAERGIALVGSLENAPGVADIVATHFDVVAQRQLGGGQGKLLLPPGFVTGLEGLQTGRELQMPSVQLNRQQGRWLRQGAQHLFRSIHARSGLLELFRFNGSEWTEEPGGPPVDYPTLTLVRAGADIYACGGSGIWRASRGWELLDPQYAEAAVWGDESGTLFLASGVGVERRDATGRTPHASLNATAVWGTPSGQLWLALRGGGLARLDRTGAREPITPEDVAPAPSLTEPEATWGSVPPDVWAGATSWGSGPTDVWRSTGISLERFDGSVWTHIVDGVAHLIDGSGANNVWTAYGSKMLHWNGQEIRDQVLPEEWIGYRIEAVRSFDFEDTWIAARDPTRARIGRFDGTHWSVVREVDATPGFGVSHFRALEGLSSQDVWVVARDGVSHFDGSAWSTPLLAAPDEQFLSLAVDERDVWALSTHNTYVRKDGAFRAQSFIHDLSKIALTGDHVWAYTSCNAHADAPSLG